MRKMYRFSIRSLLLTGACALALGAPAIAQEIQPRIKPPQMEGPPPADEPPADEPVRPGKPVPEPGPDIAPPRTTPEMPKAEEKPAETAGSASEEPAPETPPADDDGQDFINQQAVDAVAEMSERLARLESFSVKADLSWEEVLENGEKILTLEQVQADVARPDGLRMERSSPGRERIFYYNGDKAVLWGPVTRYYATVPFSGTLGELAAHLADRYAYEVPLADLFMWGHDPEQIKAIEAANFIGQDRIGERLCDHYAFRQENVDWQIWIDTAEGGLPCRYAIVDLSDPARPLFQATLEIDPEAGFYDQRFTFDPPKDAAEIPLATTRPGEDGAAPPDRPAKKDGYGTKGERAGGDGKARKQQQDEEERK
jgi:hypothetical protein